MSYNMRYRNYKVRNLFNNWYTGKMRPSLKDVSQEAGLSYNNFLKWKDGVKDYNVENIRKVEDYLRERIS